MMALMKYENRHVIALRNAHHVIIYIYMLMKSTLSINNYISEKDKILDQCEEDETEFRKFLRTGTHTERLYNLFRTNHDDIMKINNSVGELATETGVLSTAIITDVVKSVGDCIGVISTYVSGTVLVISKVGSLREKSLEDALYYGKLNICYRSQKNEGYNLLPISSFSPWNTSKYVNKYYEFYVNENCVPSLKRERCEIVPFKSTDIYISNDGVNFEKS